MAQKKAAPLGPADEGKVHQLPNELEKLASSVGKFMEYWGFKEIHGKIWTLLFLSKDPLSAIELSRKLKVSKTLLSFSIAELLSYDVIQQAGKGAKRTIYFKANPEITNVILNVLLKREVLLIDEVFKCFCRVAQCRTQLESQFPMDIQRVQRLGSFIDSAGQALKSFVFYADKKFDMAAQFLLIASALAAREKSSG